MIDLSSFTSAASLHSVDGDGAAVEMDLEIRKIDSDRIICALPELEFYGPVPAAESAIIG